MAALRGTTGSWSPAMALVLAQMEMEEADGEGGAGAAEAPAGAWRALAADEAARFRPPTRSQLREARLPSPPPPPDAAAGGGGGNCALDARAGACAAAVCCARSPVGRLLAAVLDSLPWSPRRQRALEYAALHRLAALRQRDPSLRGAGVIGNVADVDSCPDPCHRCAGGCMPISGADCVDCASLLSALLCLGWCCVRGTVLRERYFGSGLLFTAPVSRLLSLASWLAPASLGCTLVGARLRLLHVTALVDAIQHASSTFQVGGRVWKLVARLFRQGNPVTVCVVFVLCLCCVCGCVCVRTAS
jgi:hypothetical protein